MSRRIAFAAAALAGLVAAAYTVAGLALEAAAELADDAHISN